MKIISFAFLLLFTIHQSIGQSKKPKVALVLSGGGAKGIAHVPTLQVLDSLGIVPDIVIGTSMGSIVGALYASGYTPDSIAVISKTTNWAKLFSSSLPITSVSNEEKSEFKRHLTEIEWTNKKLRNKTSIINDQNINAFFNKYTYPVSNIKDFNKLPIPFKAVSVDIVNGKEVILDKGSLSFAMRASMSIPAVFSPMEYKDVLLVDGGVMNNFPADIAVAWGADIIIGSDVGGGMEPKEKLNSPVNVVLQSAMLASNLKVPENKKLCDILIDHTKYLTHTTGSFSKSLEIFEEGKLATNENMNELVMLSEKLKNYQQTKPVLPIVPDNVLIDTIIYKGISKDNMVLFKSRINIKPHNYYSLNEIRSASDNALGTNLFDAISFHIIHLKNNKLGLEIKAIEKSKNILKGSIHFDDYRGVGLFVNYTGRNIIGPSSRLVLSLDLSSDFRYRVQYQKNFGKNKDLWFRSDYYDETLDHESFVGGNYAGDIRSKHTQFDNQINLNFNSFKNYIGVGTTFDWNKITPKINPEVGDNIYNLKEYDFKNIDLYAHYVHNTLDHVFYSEKGSYFKIKLSTSLNSYLDAELIDELNEPDKTGRVNNFTKLRFNFEKRIPLSKQLVAIIGIDGGYIYFNDSHSNNSFEDYGYSAKYFLGGNIIRPRNDTFILPGLKENELAVTQFSTFKIAAQYSPLSSIYFSPHFHISTVGFQDINNYLSNIFTPTGKWVDFAETSLLTTAGITTSYNSIIGPVDFDVSWANNISGARLFFAVGYQFNLSN